MHPALLLLDRQQTFEQLPGTQAGIHLGHGIDVIRLVPRSLRPAAVMGRTAKECGCGDAAERLYGTRYPGRGIVQLAQCLDRGVPTMAMLVREVKAWERARNIAGARIRWRFTLARAREKLGRAYLSVRPTPATRAAA